MKRNRRQRYNLKDAWNYLVESRNYIYFAFGLFIFSTILGFLFGSNFSFFLDEMLKKLIEETQNMGGFELTVFIFINNVMVSFFALFLGIVFAIIPIGSSIFNGFVLGYVLNISWNASGISQFWKILPHGIFELPAVFISIGLGIRLGMLVFSKNYMADFVLTIKRSINCFLRIVIPLLIVAAIIEGSLIYLLK